MKTKVLYHASCPDGWAAAYCAWTVLGDESEYIPVQYQEPAPPIEEGDRVYIVDFSYPREVLIEMEAKLSEIRVLDHHKTAQENLLGLNFALFDMQKSGAMLAWEYWHPKEPAPELIRYIQDRDLWKHELPFTEEIYVALRQYPFEFPVWHELALLSSSEFVARLSSEGAPLLAERKREIAEKASQFHWENIGGYRVPVVEADRYYSDIANLLCKQHPDVPFAACYRFQNGKKKWDLRSIGDFDVSIIAKQFKGGGHKNSSGFSIEANPDQ